MTDPIVAVHTRIERPAEQRADVQVLLEDEAGVDGNDLVVGAAPGAAGDDRADIRPPEQIFADPGGAEILTRL